LLFKQLKTGADQSEGSFVPYRIFSQADLSFNNVFAFEIA
jgi:hypothetical protein